MLVRDIAYPGIYLIRGPSGRYILEVSHARKGELWGEVSGFRTYQQLGEQYLDVLPDDGYRFAPLREFSGEVDATLFTFGDVDAAC